MAKHEQIENAKGESYFKSFGAIRVILLVMLLILIAVNLTLLNDLNKSVFEKRQGAVKTGPNETTNNTQTPAVEFTNVTLTILSDTSCVGCNWTLYIADAFDQMSGQLGLNFKREVIDYSTNEGKGLLGEYNITKVPTILLSKEALASQQLASVWSSAGSIEEDGTLVLRNVYPPYRDLTSNEIIGRVRLIELNDSTCAMCYNVSIHKQILESSPRLVTVVNTSTYDANSDAGIELIEKYNIARIPTVIVSPELKAYLDASPQFAQQWEQLATNESDGWYVFRILEAIGNVTYKDLTTNTTQSTG